MPTRTTRKGDGSSRGGVHQRHGELRPVPIALDQEARQACVERLEQIMVDTVMLRDLYKKHHWQVAGPTFLPLHELFEKHYTEQAELVDQLAERIQLLGGVTLATPHDVAERTRIPRPPRDAEEVPLQLHRLLEAHEIVLGATREAADVAADLGDDGTNDLLVSAVIRTNEMQVWFVSAHLAPEPLVAEKAAEAPVQATTEATESPQPTA